MTGNKEQQQIFEVVQRIKEMRDICGFSVEQMAEKTEVSTEQYELYETGTVDLPFTFVHKCALAFNIGLADLLEGQSARLSTYTVTRRNGGLTTAREDGITIQNLAPLFKDKLADPYFCVYEYDEALQDKPIKLVEHAGHEFNFVIKGSLRVQVGDHIETLHSGDSIYFKSSIPHGELAVDGAPCKFLSIILNSDVTEELYKEQSIVRAKQSEKLQVEKFITTVDAENGATAGKTDLAKLCKQYNLDALHDTIHEMARDEARHGKALAGLLKRYFGK